MSAVAVLSPEELEAIVGRAVAKAISKLGEDVVLTRAEVAKLLKVNERTVVVYVAEHALPAHKLGPRDWRFHKGEVIEWMRNRGKDSGKGEG